MTNKTASVLELKIKTLFEIKGSCLEYTRKNANQTILELLERLLKMIQQSFLLITFADKVFIRVVFP